MVYVSNNWFCLNIMLDKNYFKELAITYLLVDKNQPGM